MKIYTKTGDTGSTALLGGVRVQKNHCLVSSYGTVDELNSILGIVQSLKSDPSISTKIHRIQNELFEVGADLSLPWEKQLPSVKRVGKTYTEQLEREIDEMEGVLPELTQFILPGGTQTSATLHYARTVCRRAERKCMETQTSETLNPEIIRYLNRLSDWLFCLARFANYIEKVKDTPWEKK